MENRQIPYSKAMEQLEQIVEQIDRGDVDVDELADSVKQAVLLVRMCRERLRSTQAEVEQALEEMDEASGGSSRCAPSPEPGDALPLDLLSDPDPFSGS